MHVQVAGSLEVRFLRMAVAVGVRPESTTAERREHLKLLIKKAFDGF